MATAPNGKNGANDHRGADGRWLLGNAGGPGRKVLNRALQIRIIAQENATDDNVRSVMNKLLQMALEGDVRAANEWLTRVCGKPMEVELTEGDTHNHYPILVTTTAEAIKQLEANRGLGDDPLRGIKRLPKGDGK